MIRLARTQRLGQFGDFEDVRILAKRSAQRNTDNTNYKLGHEGMFERAAVTDEHLQRST
jgi:hypothetical protein